MGGGEDRAACLATQSQCPHHHHNPPSPSLSYPPSPTAQCDLDVREVQRESIQALCDELGEPRRTRACETPQHTAPAQAPIFPSPSPSRLYRLWRDLGAGQHEDRRVDEVRHHFFAPRVAGALLSTVGPPRAAEEVAICLRGLFVCVVPSQSHPPVASPAPQPAGQDDCEHCRRGERAAVGGRRHAPGRQ